MANNAKLIASAAQKLELAHELLEDIELSRLSLEALLLKATRLARLMGPEDAQQWLATELSGYFTTSQGFERYADLTWRWTDRAKNLGCWAPLPRWSRA